MLTVQLLAYTPEPEKVIAAAARLCYSDSSVKELMNNMTPEKTEDFIERLAKLGHLSPMEHVSFTFAIEGVSRAFLAQVTRHRIASYSVQSQRYVSKKDFPYITPPYVKSDPKANMAYEKAMEAAGSAYEEIADILTDYHTQRLIDEGKDEKTAKREAIKVAIEDARFVLPNACDTKMVMTMNVRSLFNFFNLRCCNRAQWEIHQVADLMLAEVKKVAPKIFKNSGPKCVVGPCPEGNMTCGKIVEVREKYKNM